MMRSILAAGAVLLSCGLTSQAQGYHITDHWKVGGQGGWDYLLSDDAAHRLYIAHNSRVEVVSTVDGKLIGAVTGLKSTHGVVLNPDGVTGYISDGAGNAIVVFDRKTLAVTATVPAGTNPDGMAFEPATNTVWAFNGRSSNVSVMDTATNRVVATIPLPGTPEFPQAGGTGLVFVNIENKNEMVVLDAKTRQVVATWPLTGCDSPSGLSIDPVKHRLFAVCDGGKMAVVDDKSGKVLALAPIGDGPDAAGFDPNRQLAFSSNGGDGTISVIDTKKSGYPRSQTVTTERGARTMALDATTGRIYVATAKFGPPPAATATNSHPRPSIAPDSFQVIVVSP